MTQNTLKNKENWTKDEHGEYVDWTKPPYRNEKTGRSFLVLEGEDPAKIPTAVRRQRIDEYYKLCRRNAKRKNNQRTTP